MKIYILHILLGFIAVTSYAQPTLTQSSSAFAAGDQFTLNMCPYLNSGAGGANQSWNLSALTSTDIITYLVMTASSTPNGNNFPNANVSLVGFDYTYFNSTPTALQFYGYEPFGTTVFSNPEDFLHFPFNYSDSYVDSWSANGSNNTSVGTSTVTYDGYGSLTLPNGTYTNVARVHTVKTYTNTTSSSSTYYRDHIYSWYGGNVHHPILTVRTWSSSATGVSSATYYLDNITTDLSQNSFIENELKISPNPASEVLFIELTGNESDVEMYDVAGKIIRSNKIEDIGSHRIVLNVSDLENGVYFIRMRSESGARNKKVIIQH